MPVRPRSRPTRLPAPSFALEHHRLANGLDVVLAPDRSAPAVAIAVVYDVGFRSEPEGRTGFAHLFEHLMFEGSASLEKMEHAHLVQGNGGVMNGSTRSDYTNYYEHLPSSALELGLFLEADRMRSVRLTEENLANQIAVVKEEIRVNVLNRPYGGFPWISLPPVMFDTFNNAHNGYGSFVDLEAATLDDAADFFRRFYAPGNATLAVVGDLDPDATVALVERHFGDIAGRPVPSAASFAEPVPTAERRAEMPDPLAPMPALALGYRVPDPLGAVDEYLAAVVLADVLAEGDASRLYQRLVKHDQVATHVGGYLGTFGDPLDVRDPTMLQVLAYHPGPARPLIAAVDEEAARLAEDGLEADELDRVVTTMVAQANRRVDDFMARALTIAALQQLRGTADLVNDLPAALGRVTAEAVRAAAATWLRPQGRAVLEVVPGEAA